MTVVMSCWLVSTAQASFYGPDIFLPGDPVFFTSTGGTCTGNNNPNNTNDTVSSTSCKSLAYTHSLSDFNTSTDTLTSAWLTLLFVDDANPFGDAVSFTETFDLRYGNVQILDQSIFSLQLHKVTDSMNHGQLEVTISRHTGDFKFVGSALAATGTSVPEPSASLLLGLGLLGIAGYRRFQKQPRTV